MTPMLATWTSSHLTVGDLDAISLHVHLALQQVDPQLLDHHLVLAQDPTKWIGQQSS
jgi:hypothetical protein